MSLVLHSKKDFYAVKSIASPFRGHNPAKNKNKGGFFVKKIIEKEIKIWLAASVIGIFLALMITMYTQTYAKNIQNEISQNVIRFHVMANSDGTQDQILKNLVRDGILDRFGNKLDPTVGIEDTRTFLLEHIEDIRGYAAYILQNEGFDYPVKALLGNAFFPTRMYGDMAFPAGEYEALRLIIGEGRGSNWWCVMFPPLCYIEAATPSSEEIIFDDYTLLRHLLSDETYAIMNHSQRDASVTLRFRIVEWWQERMHEEGQPPTLYIQN